MIGQSHGAEGTRAGFLNNLTIIKSASISERWEWGEEDCYIDKFTTIAKQKQRLLTTNTGLLIVNPRNLLTSGEERAKRAKKLEPRDLSGRNKFVSGDAES